MLEDAGLDAPDVNGDLSESMSDGVDRLLAKQENTRPESVYRQTRLAEVFAGSPWEEVGIFCSSHEPVFF